MCCLTAKYEFEFNTVSLMLDTYFSLNFQKCVFNSIILIKILIKTYVIVLGIENDRPDWKSIDLWSLSLHGPVFEQTTIYNLFLVYVNDELLFAVFSVHYFQVTNHYDKVQKGLKSLY